jgi:hypothetical protein
LIVIGYGVIAIAATFGIAMLLPASLILRGTLAQLPPLPDKFAFMMFWMLSVASVFYATRNFSPSRVAVSMSVIAYCLLAYIYIFAMPAAEAYRGEKQFARATIEKSGNRVDQIAMFKTQGPLFYLNPAKPMLQFEKKQDLLDAIQKGDVRWFIARRRDVPKLDLPITVEVNEASYPWETDYNLRNKVQLIRVDTSASPPSESPH